MITARWTPTQQDVRLAVRAARLSGPFRVRHAMQLRALVVLAVIGTLVLLGWLLLDRFVASALAAPFALLLASPYVQDQGGWGTVYARQPVEATLAEDELRHTGTGAVRFVSSWPWTAFRYAVETPDQFVLVGHRDRSGFVPYLPKRALEDPDAVRAWLAARLEVR